MYDHFGKKEKNLTRSKSNQEAPLEQQTLENLFFHKGNEYTAALVKANFSEQWK